MVTRWAIRVRIRKFDSIHLHSVNLIQTWAVPVPFARLLVLFTQMSLFILEPHGVVRFGCDHVSPKVRSSSLGRIPSISVNLMSAAVASPPSSSTHPPSDPSPASFSPALTVFSQLLPRSTYQPDKSSLSGPREHGSVFSSGLKESRHGRIVRTNIAAGAAFVGVREPPG